MKEIFIMNVGENYYYLTTSKLYIRRKNKDGKVVGVADLKILTEGNQYVRFREEYNIVIKSPIVQKYLLLI